MPAALLPIVSGEWQWWLRDVDGTLHALSHNAYYNVLIGETDTLMVPVRVAERELPLRAGSQRQGVRVDSRSFDLPLLIQDISLAAVVDRHEALVGWVDPVRGTVAVVVTRPDGTEREIVGTYEGGLETIRDGIGDWQRVLLRIRAHDPYWRDTADTEVEFAAAVSSGAWFDFFTPFPTALASSTVVDSINVVNDGGAEAYPVWTITGPGSAPNLRNLTTGKYFGLDVTLLAGQVVTVDATPLVALPVRDAAGNPLLPMKTAGSTLWPLGQGSNRVQVEVQDAVAGETTVTLAYRRRWARR